MHKLSDPLQLLSIDEDAASFTDGSLAAGFALKGADLSCASAESTNTLAKNLEGLIKAMPAGYSLQIYYDFKDENPDLVSSHKGLVSSSNQEYLNAVDSRINFHDKKQKNRKYFFPDVYVFFRSTKNIFPKQKLFETDEEYKTKVELKTKNHSASFFRELRIFERSLSAAGLRPEKVSSKRWFKLLFEHFNPGRIKSVGLPKLQQVSSPLTPSIQSQIFLTDLSQHIDCLEFDGRFAGAISLKTMPESFTVAAMGSKLLNLPFHYRVSLTVKALDQSAEQSSLGVQRRIAHSMASGAENVSDIESEAKLASTQALMEELHSGSEKIVALDLAIIVEAGSKEQLKERSILALKCIREMDGAEGVKETYGLKDVFFKSAAGMCKGERETKVKSSNASHLLPAYSPWEGNKRPVCLLANRQGGLFALDPFESSLPNWNGIVFGGSGSGKSFTVAFLMLQFHAVKPKIIWIDNGQSSRRLVETLGGQYFDLGLDSGYAINMFDLPEGELKPSATKIKLILAVLEMILKDASQKALPKLCRSNLESAISEVYENYQNPRLTDLKKILEGSSEKRLRDYAQILESWTGDSPYGQILDRPSNVNLEKNLVSIEVGSLSASPDLKDAMLLLLTNFIELQARADLATPYLLIVDEAERLFQTEMARQFVITCYRTWRKYNAGIWSLSQNYKDFFADPALKDSLLPNTTSLLVLKQRGIDWNNFQEAFDFHEGQLAAVKSLQVKKGEYSELYYQQDQNQTVLRIVPDKGSYSLCTSDAADKIKLDKK